MNYLLCITLILTTLTSTVYGCSQNCCYTPVKFYCCRCEDKTPTAAPITTPPPGPGPTPAPYPVIVTGSSVNVVTVNTNEQSNLRNDVELTNTISNVNKIQNPISIHNTNINSVSNIQTPVRPTAPTQIIRVTDRVLPVTPTIPTTPTTTTKTTTCKSEEQNETDCCTVVKPCYYQGCQHSVQTCGQQCVAPVVYIPYNPCPSYGCYKRNYWTHTRCAQSSCHFVRRDCSMCQQNFYLTYASFMKCYGCFSYGGGYGGGYVY